MPLIHLTTFIAAPRERVFDLSRNVNLHRQSMSAYNEQIIDGVMNGLMKQGDTVTWKARHFYGERVMRVMMTGVRQPDFFVDEQVSGDLGSMKHEHYFKAAENGTIMIDQFHFELPSGIIRRIIGKLYLTKYLSRLLKERNEVIKTVAEGNQWKQFLTT